MFRKLIKSQGGFTLIELMIVIVIIGILAGIAVPKLTGVRENANLAVVQGDLRNLQTTLEMYSIDKGAYPNKTETLDALEGDYANKDILINDFLGEDDYYEYWIDDASSPTEYLVVAKNGDGDVVLELTPAGVKVIESDADKTDTSSGLEDATPTS
ncbi:MAG: type IV pilin protein [bacterium]